MSEEIWQQSKIIFWSQILLESYEKILKRPLIERKGNLSEQAKALFFAPFVVVSHGTEPDPILNYGNQVALDLWEMNWQELTQTPSRLTAEPVNRQEREQMLASAREKGFINNYRGVRISKTKKRFLMEDGTIWNLTSDRGEPCGQAATFSHWSFVS
jgi:MEKHLA domain